MPKQNGWQDWRRSSQVRMQARRGRSVLFFPDDGRWRLRVRQGHAIREADPRSPGRRHNECQGRQLHRLRQPQLGLSNES